MLVRTMKPVIKSTVKKKWAITITVETRVLRKRKEKQKTESEKGKRLHKTFVTKPVPFMWTSIIWNIAPAKQTAKLSTTIWNVTLAKHT